MNTLRLTLSTIHGSEPSFRDAGTTRKGAARRLIRTIEPPIAPNPSMTEVELLFDSSVAPPISQYSLLFSSKFICLAKFAHLVQKVMFLALKLTVVVQENLRFGQSEELLPAPPRPQTNFLKSTGERLRLSMLLSRSSKVYTRALCKHGGSLYKKNAAFNTKLFSTNKPSDRDLLLEYTTMSSFISKLWNLMFDSEERKRYYKLQKDGVLSSDSYFSPVWTYVCLENPLLKRYDIEGADLIEGAKFSYDALTKALSSKDFYDHLRGDIEHSESNDFLASVQSPEVYNAWRVSTKQFDDTGMKFSLKNLIIQQVALRNIVTKIVPGDIPVGTEFMTDLERAMYVEMTEKFTGKKVPNNNNQPSSTVDTLEPPSSQVAAPSTVKSTAASATSSGTSTIVLGSQTPTTNTAAIAASLLKQAPSTPASTATTTAATTAPAATAGVVSSDTFKVQPATRRTNRAVIAVRTGDETNPNTTVPEVADDSIADHSSTVGTGEHPHVPPITAEGTPVKAKDDDQSDTQPETPTEVEEEPVVKKTGYARDNELFPPGSVLAYVDVQYKVLEESEITVQGTLEDGEKTEMVIPQKKVRDVLWSFRGCISGQVPLEWILVDINGPRAMSFKVETSN